MSLHEILGLPVDRKRVVSICGAGGKTTLMYALAEESRKTARTALFTSTHIYPPEGEHIVLPRPFSFEECRQAWEMQKVVSAGSFLEGERKFGPPPEEDAVFLCREGEAVFIEADGSRCLPLKYPGPWEPVIRPETTHVVVVAGLSALGRSAEEVIHRLPLAREVMDIPDGPVSPETAAELMWKGYGRFSPVFLLNQADTPQRIELGERMAMRLFELGAGHVVALSLNDYI